MLAQSELLPGTALDGTTIHGPACATTANHQAETGLRLIVVAGENQDVAIGDPVIRRIEHGAELITAEQTLITGKGKRSGI